MKILKSIADFLANATVRRLIVSLLGLGVVALNKKAGMNLDADQIYGMVLLVLGYVAQSAVKEGVVAHADAKALIADAMAPKAPEAKPNP